MIVANPAARISLTEEAATYIRQLIGEEEIDRKGLRIYIETGGCSGMVLRDGDGRA